jgi:glycosyltransferase involved in cell wall biosynthesis
MTDMPLVSIVTPSFNQAPYIQETIESVINQRYPHIEYIIIDGGSTDSTIDILRQYTDKLRWYSEPDEGQTDAINKGFRLATGSIMAWLNSDDVYLPDTVGAIVQHFMDYPEDMFVYGDVLAMNASGKEFGRRHHVKQTDFKMLLYGVDAIVQPGSFWRREVWTQLGELDTSLNFVMDYEYWLRVAQHHRLKYLPIILAKERIYSQAKTYRAAIERIKEIDDITDRYGNNGFPSSYKHEAAALYTQQALYHFSRGRFRSGIAHLRHVCRLRPALHKYWVHLILVFLPGAWLPQLLLWRSQNKT